MPGTYSTPFTTRSTRTAVLAISMISAICLTPSAWAQTQEESSDLPKPDAIVTALKDSKRRPRDEREHFYNFRGPVEYIYETADGETVALLEHIKSVPDKRLYKKRHPVKTKVNQVRGVIVWASPFWTLAWGVVTSITR